jgi:hypothetical protein
MPAAASAAIVSRSDEAGPNVQTIFALCRLAIVVLVISSHGDKSVRAYYSNPSSDFGPESDFRAPVSVLRFRASASGYEPA